MDEHPVLPQDKAARRRWIRRLREIDDLLSLVEPSLDKPLEDCRVVDLGCGAGSLSIPIAKRVKGVVGIDTNERLIDKAKEWADGEGLDNTRFEAVSVLDFDERGAFDLAICSDVLEHVPDQRGLIEVLVRSLRVNGAFYMTTNNKLWPLEGHHKLPFLSYLPRKWADRYVRFMGKGEHFRIYPLTLLQLKKLLSDFPLRFELEPPRNPKTVLYRLGKRLVKADEVFWNLANAFQVIGVRLK
ncbi:MAG: class I SAM-dependent methyltransferase [Thermoplasmata archaeon]